MPSRRRGAAPLAIVLALFALLALAPAASAAQRLITIRTPGPFVDPATQSFNGPDHPGRLQANVLLPDGYAANPRKRWPLLLLLHGAGDNWESWSLPERGDIRNTAKGLNAVIVMPEGARGFYADWWNDGKRRDPAWERHIREYLLPLVERRFRIRAGRRWHAIAGLSMGGYGTLLTAAQNPGYFGTAVPMSAFASIQRPEVEPFFPYVTSADYETIYGPRTGFYATGHNPPLLARNLRHTRMYVFTGDGTQDPEKPAPSNPLSLLLEARPEDLQRRARRRPARGRRHRHLHRPPGLTRLALLARGPAGGDRPRPLPQDQALPAPGSTGPSPSAGRCGTCASASPSRRRGSSTSRAAGKRLRAKGSGRVTISNGRGCRMTAKLPFRRTFPPRRCR